MDLDRKRRCGFLPVTSSNPGGPVWARKHLIATSCPKSLISAASRAWLEEYRAWKLLGAKDFRGFSARQLDAFCTLEREATAERNNSDE